MSATDRTETFTLTRSDVVEALATVYAAASLFTYAADDEAFAFPRDDARDEAVMGLYAALCRRLGHDPGDGYHTDPVELAILARAQELEADLIDAVVAKRADEAARLADEARRSPARSAQLREYAARLREPDADLDTTRFPSIVEAASTEGDRDAE